MERLIAGLTQLVLRGKPSEPPREVEVDLDGAPECVKALAQALSTHNHYVELGEFSMYMNEPHHRISDLAGTIQMACENAGLDPSAAGDFETGKTLQLGADGGGMSYFGVGWSRGELRMIVVEFEDPTEDNLLKQFATPAEFFAFLDERNEDEKFPDLDALRA